MHPWAHTVYGQNSREGKLFWRCCFPPSHLACPLACQHMYLQNYWEGLYYISYDTWDSLTEHCYQEWVLRFIMFLERYFHFPFIFDTWACLYLGINKIYCMSLVEFYIVDCFLLQRVNRSPVGLKIVTSCPAITTTTTSHRETVSSSIVGRGQSPRGHSPTRERESYRYVYGHSELLVT